MSDDVLVRHSFVEDPRLLLRYAAECDLLALSFG